MLASIVRETHRCVPAADAQRRRSAITPPLCGPCGRQHDPAQACDPEAALGVYTPSRSAGQDDADDLEAMCITRYLFHRPLHLSARFQQSLEPAARAEPAEPACPTPRATRPTLPMAIAALIAFLALDLVVTVLVATGLH
jgi:hypothetical protein